MKTYILLLRGVNVGGKNAVSMATLRNLLEEQSFESVKTYINSGNVLLNSSKNKKDVQHIVERTIIDHFDIDSELIKVLVLEHLELRDVINDKPSKFAEQPNVYHSDVIFLMGISAESAIKAFNPRDGVDKIWSGKSVIYSERLSSQRTKSRLNKIMSSPSYKSMTIRNWNTVEKLVKLADDMASMKIH